MCLGVERASEIGKDEAIADDEIGEDEAIADEAVERIVVIWRRGGQGVRERDSIDISCTNGGANAEISLDFVKT